MRRLSVDPGDGAKRGGWALGLWVTCGIMMFFSGVYIGSCRMIANHGVFNGGTGLRDTWILEYGHLEFTFFTLRSVDEGK